MYFVKAILKIADNTVTLSECMVLYFLLFKLAITFLIFSYTR